MTLTFDLLTFETAKRDRVEVNAYRTGYAWMILYA